MSEWKKALSALNEAGKHEGRAYVAYQECRTACSLAAYVNAFKTRLAAEGRAIDALYQVEMRGMGGNNDQG